MRLSRAVWLLAVAGWIGAGALGCSYDPHIKDGDLLCSLNDQKCPDGYECRSGACYAATSGNKDAGLADVGLGGDTIAPAVLKRYLGAWRMDDSALRTDQCDDGTSGTEPVTPLGTIMEITAGEAGLSDLQSKWLCDLGLRLDATGAHLSNTDPSCSQTFQYEVQTWTTSRFDLVTTDGLTATHVASYTLVDRFSTGKVVTCTQLVTASLTKY